MTCPRLEIDLDKITHNTRVLVGECKKFGIGIVGITKVSSGMKELVEAIVDGGINIIGESRIGSLKKLKDLDIKKMMIRLPMPSEAKDVVTYSDISLNSELETIIRLSEEAIKLKKKHKVILMIDVGDLREGCFGDDEIFGMVGRILELEGVELIGVGTNLSCFGGIIPSEDNLNTLINIKNQIEERYDIHIPIVSGGNSSSLHLIQNKKIPKGINQLRLGTSLILGTVEINNSRMENTYNDAFKLVTEIIEIKNKPSIPIGQIARDSFGQVPAFEDKGIRKRAICAIGKQDIDIEWMEPQDKDIYILGASSDHLIVDVTDSKIKYGVGNNIVFIMDYVSILNAMTSEHVKKVFFKSE